MRNNQDNRGGDYYQSLKPERCLRANGQALEEQNEDQSLLAKRTHDSGRRLRLFFEFTGLSLTRGDFREPHENEQF
jgi:hypothetical protein